MSALASLFVTALLAALGVAVAAAPLGCVVVWRRMAFFGDATAHAAILGVALAVAVEAPIVLGVFPAALAMAFLVYGLTGRGLGEDTVLAVLSHGALALGLIVVSLLPGVRIDLAGLLLGDILAVGWQDVAIIWIVAVAVCVTIFLRWRGLLVATLDPDLAVADGHDPRREAIVVLVALALTVAISVKIVGVLLVAALLVIPAATARMVAATPERMVFVAGGVATLSAILGLVGSFAADLPSGPSIVTAAAMLFAAALLLRRPA